MDGQKRTNINEPPKTPNEVVKLIAPTSIEFRFYTDSVRVPYESDNLGDPPYNV